MSRRETFLTLLFAIVTTAAIVCIGTRPRAGDDVVVFVAPWSAPQQIARVVALSGGQFVSATNLDWAVVARSDEEQFANRLYANGALAIAGSSIAALCSSSQQYGKSDI